MSLNLAVLFYDHDTHTSHALVGGIASCTIGRSTVSIWRNNHQIVAARRIAGNGKWRVTKEPDAGRFSDVFVGTQVEVIRQLAHPQGGQRR